jgi:hypothetical protein
MIHFQMLSKMSSSELKTIGYSLGLCAELDNWKSKVYNSSLSATITNRSGNGVTNNSPFTADTVIGGGSDSITSAANQFDRVANTGIQKRLGRYDDTTGGDNRYLFGTTAATIASLSQLNNDFASFYQVVGTSPNQYMVWFVYLLFLKHLTILVSLVKLICLCV